MKITIKLPKPRNPFAMAARQKKAGAHDKTEKAKRQAARQALQKELKGERGDAPFFSPWRYSPTPSKSIS